MSVELKKPLFDQIWPQFLFSSDFSEFDERIIEDSYNLKQQFPSCLNKSNVGGWHSEVFSDSGSEAIIELKNSLIEVCNEVITDLTTTNFKIERGDWWVNINTEGNFHIPHSHGSTKIVGIYYPQVPEKPGLLSLYRPDRNDNLRGYEQSVFNVTPQKSRAYLFPGHILHAVLPNESSEVDRISVAFNFF
jgi:uncharacterized protein (TIGR02466 family)